MSNPDRLIAELEHNAAASGNKTMERRLADLVIWYYKNRQQIPPDNLAARNALNEKALWISLEMFALLAERIHDLEGTQAGSHLWTPSGVAVGGDLRRFG